VSFKAYKIYITAMFTHLVLQLYKSKYLRWYCNLNLHFLRLRLMLQTRVSYALFQHAIVIREEFCHGLEMRSTSSFGGILQGGAPETAAESFTPCFTSGK